MPSSSVTSDTLDVVGQWVVVKIEVHLQLGQLDGADDRQGPAVGGLLVLVRQRRPGVQHDRHRVEEVGEAAEEGLPVGRDRAAGAGVVAGLDDGLRTSLEVADAVADLEAQRRGALPEDRRGEQPVDLDVGRDEVVEVRRVVDQTLRDVDEVDRHENVGQQVAVDVDRHRHLRHAHVGHGQVQQADVVRARVPDDRVGRARKRERDGLRCGRARPEAGGQQQREEAEDERTDHPRSHPPASRPTEKLPDMFLHVRSLSSHVGHALQRRRKKGRLGADVFGGRAHWMSRALAQ